MKATPPAIETEWDIEVAVYGGVASLNAYKLIWAQNTQTDFQFERGDWYVTTEYEDLRQLILAPVDLATLGLGEHITDDEDYDYSQWTCKNVFEQEFPHTTQKIRDFLASLESYTPKLRTL